MSPVPEFATMRQARPKLRQDVIFLEAPAGVYVKGKDTAFLLKGRTAFRWLCALSPYLTGEHSLDDICAPLAESQQQTVASLVHALTSRGFAKDVAGASVAPEPIRQRFASQLEFIDHFADDPASRFERFRFARVALAGEGETLLAAAAGLLRNGCEQVTVHPSDDRDRYEQALRAVFEDSTFQVSPQPLDPDNADVVIFCADRGELPRLLDLTRHCHRSGPLLVPVVWGDGQVVMGPTVSAGQSPCWLCGQLRLAASSAPATAAAIWRQMALGPVRNEGRTVAPIDPVPARMIGNAAAFEVFRVMTGALSADTAASVLLLDGDTLESSREHLLPHPECPVCGGGVTDQPEPPASLTDEEIYQRAGILVSPNLGVFTRFVDDPLEQAPLKTARLRVPGHGGPREITAFDVHTVMAARLGAYRIAVRDYLARVARPDGTVRASAAELAASGRTPVPWSELVTASPAVAYEPQRRLDWVPAVVPGEPNEPVWVPAALALPFSAANRDGHAERTVAGSAVGASRAEVISSGLASALAYRGLVDAMRRRAGLLPVTEAELVTDDDTALIMKAAHRFGRVPQVFTLPGAAPAHAVLAVLPPSADPRESPLWTVGTGQTARDARLAALRDLVGRVQVQHFEGTDACLGDPLLADFDPRTAALSLPAKSPEPPVPEPAAPQDLLPALAGHGLTALLVEHATPDIRATQALLAGVVLLWRRAAAP